MIEFIFIWIWFGIGIGMATDYWDTDVHKSKVIFVVIAIVSPVFIPILFGRMICQNTTEPDK